MTLHELVRAVAQSWTQAEHSLWVARVLERDGADRATCHVLEIRRGRRSVRLYEGLPTGAEDEPSSLCPVSDTHQDWKVFRMDLAFEEGKIGLLTALHMLVTDCEEPEAREKALAKAGAKTAGAPPTTTDGS